MKKELSFNRNIYILKKISDKLKKLYLYKLSIIFNNLYMEKVQRFLTDFYNKNNQFQSFTYSLKGKKNLSEPIFIFWATGIESAPELIKKCYDKLKKTNYNSNIELITDNNISEYIDFPNYILEKYKIGEISKAQFSDILRFSLLSLYGGYWIDATILVTQNLKSKMQDFDVFSIKNKNFNKWNISKRRWTSYFWYAKKNNYFIKKVNIFFLSYWKQYDFLIDYFLVDHIINLLYENDKRIKQIIDSIPSSNPEVSSLQPLLDSTFQEEDFKSLSKETYLFKLNWKVKFDNTKEKTYWKILFS